MFLQRNPFPAEFFKEIFFFFFLISAFSPSWELSNEMMEHQHMVFFTPY